MWGGSDEQESIATIQSALDHGINLIDTAPVYGFGRAEEIVGKAIAAAGMRDRVVIATKVGLGWQDDRPFRNASRQRILLEIDESLRRLGVYRQLPTVWARSDASRSAMMTLGRHGGRPGECLLPGAARTMPCPA
jgi:aryl-alcohol dehydrogenase-like predicted oxidoreductase